MRDNTNNYGKVFKDIYYYLYSNSNTSRAERIVSDITKVLLCKLIEESDTTLNLFNKSTEEMLNILRQKYPETCDQFDSFSMSESDLRKVFEMLENISLNSAPSHVVGDAFQAIMGPNIRGDKGQFFTPKSLVECMIKVIAPQQGEVIMDPACGTGGFLTESYAYSYEGKKRNRKSKYIGIDKDKDMADLASVVMEILADDMSKVFNLNSLEIVKTDHKLHDLLGTIDVILTNPPFGTKIGIDDKSILKEYDFGYNWTYSAKDGQWYKLSKVLKSQDPQILFIELCLKLLKKGGRMAIVLPEGVFGNKSQGYIWAYLQQRGKILAMIDCPRNTFQPSTDTKTNVLFFEKNTKSDKSDTWVAVAKSCGHDRRGRTTNSKGDPLANDFIAIGDDYSNREKETSFWKKVVLRGNYFVPRYFENESIVAQYKESKVFISLGELIEKGYLEKHSGHEVGSEAYGTGSIPFIRTSDLNNYELSSDPTNSVSEEVYLKYNKQQNLAEGDVLFIADGRYRIGKSAILNSYNKKCVVQSHIDIFSLKEGAPFNPYEFFYLLNSKIVQEQIRNLVFIQSTLGTLGNRILEIQIPIPDRDDAWNKEIHAFQINLEMRARTLYELNKTQYSFEL